MLGLTIKQFRLATNQIKPLAEGYGGCIATDKITVDGYPVRFMYREAPDNDVDSGWRFMSGFEDDRYMDDPANHAIYDVNTIANYDPTIIPFLEAPEGSVFDCRLHLCSKPRGIAAVSNASRRLFAARDGGG